MGVADFGTLLAVATGITKAVDWVRTRFDKAGHAPKDLWIALALGAGVIFAVVTHANLLDGVSWASHVSAVSGRIATGLALGGAASGSHELLDFLSGAAKATHAHKTALEAAAGVIDDPDGGEPIPEE